MKVTVVVPVLSSDELVDKCRIEYREAASPGTEVEFAPLDVGTSTIESWYDMSLAQPDTIRKIMEAEADGADATIIACFGDPGGAGAKEAVSIPVIGEGEAGFHLASLYSRKFSVITVRRETIPLMEMVAAAAGFSDKLASVRPVDFSVMDFSLEAVEDVVEQARSAILEDGAEGFVMGCTGTGIDMSTKVSEALHDEFGFVPVVDPVKAAMGLAELSVRTGYRASRISYPVPLSMRPEYQWAKRPPQVEEV